MTITVKEMGLDMFLLDRDGNEVGYWRKANAIYGWFERNHGQVLENGVSIIVTESDLDALRAICVKVLAVAKTKTERLLSKDSYPKSFYANRNFISEEDLVLHADGSDRYHYYYDKVSVINTEDVEVLLPTTSGFFFGSQEYDNWYLDDIQLTIDIIDKAFDLSKDEEEGDREWFFHPWY